MKYTITIISIITAFFSFGQNEEVGPLMGNPALQAIHGYASVAKVNAGTFDSTFIYTSDTLDLPFFDEFSSNHFQKYDDDFLGGMVTFDKVFRLLDMSDIPVSVDSLYTQQTTYKRIVDLQALTVVDEFFPPTEVKIGDLTSYPVAHITTNVYPPFYIFDTLQTTGGTDNSPDTVWITGAEIFQDSATQFFDVLNDPLSYWLDDEAYHNYSMGKDPWSLGVATFDGLDRRGYPYAIGSTLTNYADHLTSKPIDMTTAAEADSMYFSFVYQSKGLGDQPEVSDSLILEFFAHDLNQWNHIWSVSGSAVDTFKLVNIPVTNADYFKDGFQFRFKNYGGLSGSLDHFHVDFVELDAVPGGLSPNAALRDLAFSYPLYTLLEDYTSVPWDHYKNLTNPNDVMSAEVNITMAHSFPNPENAVDGVSNIYYAGALEGSVLLVSDVLCDDINDNYLGYDIPYSVHDFKSSYTFDQSKTGVSQEFQIKSEATIGAVNFAGNDSTVSSQIFQNYYSYDDGSAEQAYGPTGIQARLAIQYTPYESDTIVGAFMHFVPSVTDVSNDLFIFTIWGDDNGEPGDVLYEDELFNLRTPQYNYSHNSFTYYPLPDTMRLAVTGTFYVGWRQVDANRLNIGLDKNIINNQHTFYSVDNEQTWNSSSIEGSVMIRPVFSTAMNATLGIEEVEGLSSAYVKPSVKIFPNPTKSIINIEINQPFAGVEVLNMQGQLIMRSETPTVDLSLLPIGMYFLKIDGINELQKIIRD